MKAKAFLGFLLLFTVHLFAQEPSSLNIRSEDKKKFIVYVDNVPQNRKPVNTFNSPMPSGRAEVKIVFEDRSISPVIQVIDGHQSLPPLTLRKKKRGYVFDGFPAVDLNVGVQVNATSYERYESHSSSSSSGPGRGNGNGNNNGNNGNHNGNSGNSNNGGNANGGYGNGGNHNGNSGNGNNGGNSNGGYGNNNGGNSNGGNGNNNGNNGGNHNGNNYPPYPGNGNPGPFPPRENPYLPNGTICQTPTLSEVAFINLKKKMSDAYYSHAKAEVALQAIESHCLLAQQVADMVKMISAYTSEQFEVAKNGYLHMINTEDYEIVISAVANTNDQKKLREFASTAGPRQPTPTPNPVPTPRPRPTPDRPDRPDDQYPGPSLPRCEQSSCRGFSMNNEEFEQALESIRTSTFEDTKLDQAKLITRNNCLTVAQVRSIMRIFTFEESKLDYAKFAYSKSHDRKNFYLVNQEFTFDNSKSELTRYMSR